MASAGETTPSSAERQSIQVSKSTLKGLECQFYGSNTFDTFYPDPAKHKLCPPGKTSAYVLVQDLPDNIFKLADRSLSDFENTDLEKFFDKNLPASIRRPNCKVGVYEVEEQSGGGSVNKKNVVTGIAEFESAATAASAIEAMNANGPRKIMTKDDPDIISLQQVVSEEVAAIAENSKKKAQAIDTEQIEKRRILGDVNGWLSSLNNVTYHFVEHRFFAKNFPEVDDLVTVEVKKVEDLGAYVTLLEFGEIEGMVPLSELSRRRIRSVGKLVRVGRVEIVSVIRVDDKAGYIDLSKKRVSSEEKTQQSERFEKAKSVHSIIYSVGAHTGVPVETLYENIGWPLYKRFGHGFEGMRQILADPNVLSNYGISEEVKFEVIAKANKLLHSKGFKQLPMHDAASLPKADFDDLVNFARKQVVEKSENVFRPLFTMLTGQTIQDVSAKGDKEEGVSPKGSEVSAFFVLNAAGTAYTYRSAEHISAKVREVLRRNIEHKLKLNPVKVRADFDATCFGERGVEAIKDAFMEAKKIDDFSGQLPEPGSEKEPSCFLFHQGFTPQGCSEADGVQALTRQLSAHAADIVDKGVRCVQTSKNGTVGLVEFKTVEAATKALEAERARIEKSGKSQAESVVFYQLMRPRITLIAPPMYIMETTTLDQQRGINLLLKAIEVVSAKLASEDGSLKVRPGGEPRAVGAKDDKMLRLQLEAVENENREVSGDDTDEDGDGAGGDKAKPAQPAKKKDESSSDSDD